ncbi:MAG: CinA family protein [Burkholderiales bacterium]
MTVNSLDPAVLPALATLLQSRRWMLATAESCTGGLIAGACTDLAGSSAWFERGLVTYSNEAKQQLLGIDAALIERDGAVSLAVAEAMVRGALAHAPVQVAVAVTGVAGPTGGSPAKPVGTVCFGWAVPGRVWTEQRVFSGDRAQVRSQTVAHALSQLLAALRSAA